MGKAARWLRSLLGGGSGGGKKDKEQGKEQRRPPTPNAAPAPNADRKRWSFCKSSRDSSSEAEPAGVGNAAIARAAEAAWLKSLYKDTEREQSKHAIAVAAATAAAADAAVAAAHAAVEVVRLTSQGPAFSGPLAEPRGRAAAAVKIQTAFRGFLAKKALRALKALVKLQALVRGYLVRKQAAATLQSMQALVRAQASIRAARSLAAGLPHLRLNHTTTPPVRPPRYSLQERYTSTDDTRSEQSSVAAYYSRRLSASVDSSSCYDRSPKIVEMDTGRPKSRASSLRTSPPATSEADAAENFHAYSVSSPLQPYLHHQNHSFLPGAPPRISARHFPEHEWFEKARPATAQSTPRYSSLAPVTPTKSACGWYGNSPSSSTLNCPSYMSSTRSSVAKVRSQSAPRQRPEEVVGVARKRVPLSEVIILQEARASLTGVPQRPSCNRPAHEEAFNFKKAVVSRFDRSSEAAADRDRDRDLFLHKGW